MTKHPLSHKLNLLADSMRDVALDMEALNDEEANEHAVELLAAADIANEWAFEVCALENRK
jgi:hypothetical protein